MPRKRDFVPFAAFSFSRERVKIPSGEISFTTKRKQNAEMKEEEDDEGEMDKREEKEEKEEHCTPEMVALGEG